MMKRSLLVMGIAIISIAAVLPACTEEAKKEEKRVEMEVKEKEKRVEMEVKEKEKRTEMEVKEEEKRVEMERRVQSGKDILVANINAPNNQEMRVSVLRQLLNQETAKLREMEAIFCDHYNLDLKKFRAGKYRYDANTGKLTEMKE